ncbi:MAG: hypothetical protein SFV23_02405 [Planctomycetaceae bacterium]|nr:hypothetical protein [Planctomycetaceae bacterium]
MTIYPAAGTCELQQRIADHVSRIDAMFDESPMEQHEFALFQQALAAPVNTFDVRPVPYR